MSRMSFGNLEAVTFDTIGTLYVGQKPRLGLRNGLTVLRASGIQVGVYANNFNKEIVDTLALFGVGCDLLPPVHIVGKHSAYPQRHKREKERPIPGKPTGEGILHLLDMWEVHPNSAVHIGSDPLDDRLAAQAAEVAFVEATPESLEQVSVLDLVAQAIRAVN